MQPVSAADLKALLRDNEILLLDVRPEAEYRAGHIRGARSLPVAELSRRLKEIPALIDRFHELVAVATGNRELVDLLDQLRTRVNWMFEVDIEHRSEGSWADHRAILEAVIAGDEALAARLMDDHVAKDEALYRRMSSSS